LIYVEEKGQNNLAFSVLLQLGDSAACVDLLTKTQRAPEAALFARTYAPRYVSYLHSHCLFFFLTSYSQAPKAVQAWKSELISKKRTKLAGTIADPSLNPELFEEGWEEVLAREEAHCGMFFFHSFYTD
jgi:coatomer subunit beta'